MTGRKEGEQTGDCSAFEVFTQEHPQRCRLHTEKGNNCTKEWRKSHTYETQRLLFALLESFTAREGKTMGWRQISSAQCIRRRAADEEITSNPKRSNRLPPLKVHFQSKRLSPGGDNPASIHLPPHSICQGRGPGRTWLDKRWRRTRRRFGGGEVEEKEAVGEKMGRRINCRLKGWRWQCETTLGTSWGNRRGGGASEKGDDAVWGFITPQPISSQHLQ